jgi:hypothetical protein
MADKWKMPSPDNPPRSTAPSFRTLPGEPLFKTITGADWKRSLDSAKQQKNVISEQIQIAISSLSRKGK